MSWYKEKNYSKCHKEYFKDLETIFKVKNALKQWIPYKLEPHQRHWHSKDVALLGEKAKSRIVVKSRNTSFTVSSLISSLMAVSYYPEQVIPLIRLNMTRAQDLIKEAKDMIRQITPIKEADGSLYPFDPSKVNMNNVNSIKFPNGVEFRAFPANSQSSESIRGLRIAGNAGIIDECLLPEVRLNIDKGLKAICSIKQNDLIKSYNIKKNVIEYKKVLGVRRSELKEQKIVKLSFVKNTYSVKCTENHPLYDENFNIIHAKDVNIGDNLICFNNKNGEELTQIQKEILYGTLLGDGCLLDEKKYKKSAHLTITHSIKQKEYQQHLANIFDCKISDYTTTSYNGVVNNIRTKNTKKYQDLRKILYKNNRKIITEQYLNNLTDISLAYWFMDDGSSNNITITLSTHAFTEEENIIIQEWFKNKYGIIPKIMFDKRCERNYLMFNTTHSKKFIKIISKYIIPSMRYKIKNFKNIDNYKELIIQKYNHKITKVLDKKTIKKRCRVYNIEVEDNNNYMIEGMNILSHNCNFMKDFYNIYIALRDASSGSLNGEKHFQINIGTTLKGFATPFKIWFDGIKNKILKNIEVFEWPVFNTDEYDEKKHINEQDLEPIVHWHNIDDLHNLKDEDVDKFHEEFMCITVDSDSTLYKQNLIMKCIDLTLDTVNVAEAGKEYYGGVDVSGEGTDFFSISIFEKTDKGFVQKYLFLKQKVDDLDEMTQMCDDIIRLWNPVKFRVDANGLGYQMGQTLKRRYTNIVELIRGAINIKIGGRLTVPFNEFLHTNQIKLMNKGLFKMFNHEMQTKHYGSWNRAYKCDHSRKLGHGDSVISNGMACLPINWKYGDNNVGVMSSDNVEVDTPMETVKEEVKKFHNSSFKDKMRFYRR